MEYDNFDLSSNQLNITKRWFRNWCILWMTLPIFYCATVYFLSWKMYPLYQLHRDFMSDMPDMSGALDVAAFMSPLLIWWIVWMLISRSNKIVKDIARQTKLILIFVILITLFGFRSILIMFLGVIDVDNESAFGKNYYLVIYNSGLDGRGYIIYSCTRLLWCDSETLWSEVDRVSNDADLRIDRATRTLSIWVDDELDYEMDIDDMN